MLSNHEDYVRLCLSHIRKLTIDIGARGSTTAGERQGAAYCQDVLQQLGYTPRVEPFSSPKSIYLPIVFTGGLMIAAFAIYPLAQPVTAWISLGLLLVAFVCQNLELAFRDNPYRWFMPTGQSQNVVASLPSHGDHRQDLVVIGHIDTHRTPIIFSTDLWVDGFRLYATTAFIVASAQIVLYLIGALSGLGWIWPVTGLGAAFGAGLIAIGVQADLSPYTAGANDNATAVATVLALARYLQEHPLQYTRVWFACTGCEEVKHYGAANFFRRHKAELVNPKALVFEMLGCDEPGYLLREGMRPASFAADPRMAGLAAQVAEAHPEFRAHPTRVDLGYTEMADALIAGVPAITVIGIGGASIPVGYKGRPLYWHRVGDTLDKIDPEVLGHAWGYICEFINAVDNEVKH